MTQAVYLYLPIPTLDSIGWEDDAAIAGSVSLTLPPFALSVAGAQLAVGLALPVLGMAVAGNAGVVGGITFTLTSPQAVVGGLAAAVGSVTFAYPQIRVSIGGPNVVTAKFPTPTLNILGFQGAIATVTLSHPLLQLGVIGVEPFVGASTLQVMPRIQVGGITGISGATTLALRGASINTVGFTGGLGIVTLLLPAQHIGVAGSANPLGAVAFALPAFGMHVVGARAIGANFSTIVMHTESNALTTYENYQFNSFAKFNGGYFAAKEDGLFSLAGSSDAGTPIASVAQTGFTDFATSHRKRAERIYVGYRADGDMTLRVTVDETQARDYRMAATNHTGLHGTHVRVGRGVEARYWQFELQNVAGADFNLDMIEVKVTKLRRRVGGRDA